MTWKHSFCRLVRLRWALVLLSLPCRSQLPFISMNLEVIFLVIMRRFIQYRFSFSPGVQGELSQDHSGWCHRDSGTMNGPWSKLCVTLMRSFIQNSNNMFTSITKKNRPLTKKFREKNIVIPEFSDGLLCYVLIFLLQTVFVTWNKLSMYTFNRTSGSKLHKII